MTSILDILADDKDVILYRRKLRAITKSVIGTILLQQIIHRAKNQKWKPFYKFATPHNHHADYVPGDSWTEELGFSEDEFEAARSCIASKITSGAKRESITVALVYFWTDSNRKTWYEVNRELLARLTNELYDDDDSAKGEISLYREKRKFPRSKKRGNVPLHDSESTESTEIPTAVGEKIPSSKTPAELKVESDRQYDEMQSMSADLPPAKLTSAGVADPTIERKEYVNRVAPMFADVLLHGKPTDRDKDAAGKAFDKHIPLELITIQCNKWSNGDGKKIRENPKYPAHWLVNDLEDLAARKQTTNECAGAEIA